MKRYVLPSLLSLVLVTPVSFANGSASPPSALDEATPPTPYGMMPPPPPAYDAELMKKRFEQRRTMEEQMYKIMQTRDPEERRKLMDARMKEMQKHIAEMREVMTGHAYGAPMHPPRGWGAPMGPMHGYGKDGFQPPYARPQAPAMPHGPRKPMRMMGHRQQVEQRLARIEALLEQLVAAQTAE